MPGDADSYKLRALVRTQQRPYLMNRAVAGILVCDGIPYVV